MNPTGDKARHKRHRATLTREKNRYITWNEDNKPAKINVNGTDVTFLYDGNGSRVKKTKGANTTYYFGDTYEIRGAVGIIHLFAKGQRVASIRTDGTIQYYHGNHLGSASIVTDQNGTVKQKIEYFPYGTYRYGANPNQQLATYDYDNTFPNVNYTFTDQEDDDETGLYNYDARLYDPQLGRFISADTIVPRPWDLQSFNRYSYCSNNPLIYTDPSGHDPENGTSYSEDGLSDPGWTVNDDGSLSFNEQEFGAARGVINVIVGVGKFIGGLLTLNTSMIAQGCVQIGQGVVGIVVGTVRDTVGFGIGQASHLVTFPRDIYNLGKSFFDDKRGSTIAALGTTLYDLAVPRNALNGGAGYGWSIDRSGKETNTWGAFWVNLFLGTGDKINLGHDRNRDHGKWVIGQLDVIFSGRTTGVFELLYAIVGIPAFSVGAALQALGLLPPPIY